MKQATLFRCLLFATLFFAFGCDKDDIVLSPPAFDSSEAPHSSEESLETASEPVVLSKDWCTEHSVPESKCTKCNPELSAKFQSEGDWCSAHGFPESVCPSCNSVAFDDMPRQTRAKEDDWCGGHSVPESKCTKCNPELVERFERKGDWCKEHGFPESVCPYCNPMSPPSINNNDEAINNSGAIKPSDWCNEHGVPESKCTHCNPDTATTFQSEGDWCAEHKFPESVCPVCNPVTPPAGASGPQTRVQLTALAFQTSAIRTQRIFKRSMMTQAIRIPAEVQFEPGRIAHVSPIVNGQIVSVDVTVGTRVKAGDALATFRSVEIGQTRAELSRSNAVRRTARAQLARQHRLREEKINSNRDLLEAQLAFDEADAIRNAARSSLHVFGAKGGVGSGMTLTSPIDGVVIERYAVQGGNVSTDDTLFVIADTSKVWVVAHAYAQHIPNLRVGRNATLRLDAYEGREWSDTVDYIGLSLDEATRTLPVRMATKNDDGTLRPGMFGMLSIDGGETDSSLGVPASAVQSLNGRDVVFIEADAERTFEARTVTIGREVEGHVPVLKGLSDTDRVVVSGAFILKSELIRDQLSDGCVGD